jgi:hypothetical protein
MAAEKIKFSKLEEWVNCYSENAIGRETKNVVIPLDDIKALIEYCNSHPESDTINGIRFYLVRQNDFGRDTVYNGQSQISLVGVPVVNYKDNDFDPKNQLIQHDGGNDLMDNDEEIFSVFPKADTHEHSGLCPYNCRGSINSKSIIITHS